MNTNSKKNKTIAKNVFSLYIRMFFTLAVGLYTSRVLLNALGVEDYGIYSVVGGVIILFSFVKSSFTSAISRFLSFEIGKGDLNRIIDTFKASLSINIIIALIIVILAETIGLWFLENKLVISKDRMHIAKIVYHLSLFTAVIEIIKVSFNSLLISREKMNVYAIIEIIFSFIKLVFVIILTKLTYDKLLLHGFLTALASLLVFAIYVGYCVVKFEECKIGIGFKRDVIKPMLSFSTINLYGSLSVIARSQGVNILLNMFFGVVLNTANAIAIQIQNAILTFSNNIIIAVQPQIVKSYAQKDYEYSKELLLQSSKYIFLLIFMISLPIYLEMEYILELWLNKVPEYSVVLCRLTLIFNIIAVLSTILANGLHATGNIKTPNFVNGTLYMLVAPITYIMFKNGFEPETPFILNIVFVFIGMTMNVLSLNKYLPQFKLYDFFNKVFLVVVLISFITFFITNFVSNFFNSGFSRLLVTVLTSFLSIIILTYFIGTDKKTKENLFTLIKQKL